MADYVSTFRPSATSSSRTDHISVEGCLLQKFSVSWRHIVKKSSLRHSLGHLKFHTTGEKSRHRPRSSKKRRHEAPTFEVEPSRITAHEMFATVEATWTQQMRMVNAHLARPMLWISMNPEVAADTQGVSFIPLAELVTLPTLRQLWHRLRPLKYSLHFLPIWILALFPLFPLFPNLEFCLTMLKDIYGKTQSLHRCINQTSDFEGVIERQPHHKLRPPHDKSTTMHPRIREILPSVSTSTNRGNPTP